MPESMLILLLTATATAGIATLLTWLIATRRINALTTRAVTAEAQLAVQQQLLTERQTLLQEAQGRAQQLDETLQQVQERERAASEALAQTRATLEAEQQRRAEAQTELQTTEQHLREQEALLQETTAALASTKAELQSERNHHTDKLAALEAAETRLSNTFNNLSGQALQSSVDHFLNLANDRLSQQQQTAQANLDALIHPLREALDQQHKHTRELEEARQKDYGSINKHLTLLEEQHKQLRQETANLVNALRQPQVRGRWGEIQLRRVVELAGMSDCCDFVEQQSISDAEGARLRPDLQVRLPNQRTIVVDAKVPLSAYLDAFEATDEVSRTAHLKRHASQIRAHINDMAKRDYQNQIDGAYGFLVLFIPGEVFYSAALEQDRELLEDAFQKRIILATPTTLIALLKAVALGWSEVRLSQDAQRIKDAADKVYGALGVLAKHITDLGSGLKKSVDSYNKTIGSIERNLLSSARRMHDLEVGRDAIDDLPLLEEGLRAFSKAELVMEPERTDRAREAAEGDGSEVVPAA